VEALFNREREAWAGGTAFVAGVDEAGRGPLAGPVVAGAVIFTDVRIIPRLNDSKQLTPEEREALYVEIVASGASVGVGVASVDEINRYNILGATRMAWGRAVESLSLRPALILIDGNASAAFEARVETIVRGDALCASIAAASIVAKVVRDRLMADLDQEYPAYGFARHKGYATAEHIDAVRRVGPSPVHRTAFLSPDLYQLALHFGQ
jgi:ribonuclease HII